MLAASTVRGPGPSPPSRPRAHRSPGRRSGEPSVQAQWRGVHAGQVQGADGRGRRPLAVRRVGHTSARGGAQGPATRHPRFVSSRKISRSGSRSIEQGEQSGMGVRPVLILRMAGVGRHDPPGRVPPATCWNDRSRRSKNRQMVTRDTKTPFSTQSRSHISASAMSGASRTGPQPNPRCGSRPDPVGPP